VFTYVVRRVLLMVPTLFGITMIVWLLMVASPGRPGTQASAGGSDSGAAMDPSKERAKGESQRIFRRHFALDRPLFWNSWTDLDDDDVLEAVRLSRAPIEDVGAKAKREASERLEDWGDYAVPALVRLLAATAGEPARQDEVLHWLRLNSVRVVESSYGKTPDAATVARNQAWAKENYEIAAWRWRPEDPPARRAEVVGLWQGWYERSRAARWEWGWFARLRIAATDTQFATYWSHLLRLDFGASHHYKRPVWDLISERLPVSLFLSLVSLLIVYVLAIPLGIFSAVRPYTVTDRTMTIGLFLLYSLPSFFVGTVLLRLLTVGEPFRWFPTGAFEGTDAISRNTWDRVTNVLWHTTLPLVTLSYGGLAGLSRFARTGMLDVIRSDYVRTARAKGLSESTVILRHAARNGMMPVVTLLGGTLPALLGGSVIVEFVFNIPGMGTLMLEAILNKDFNIVMAESVLVAVLTMVGILLADVLYAVMDPRISYS
jgi:peptide/nickel transport system permease protein